jgi:hypothetical protein
MVLAMMPSYWFRIIDPLARAANENQAVSKEVKAKIDKTAKKFLGGLSIVLTFLTLVGFC